MDQQKLCNINTAVDTRRYTALYIRAVVHVRWKGDCGKAWKPGICVHHLNLKSCYLYQKKTHIKWKKIQTYFHFSCLHFLMVIENKAHWSVKVYYACPSLEYIFVKHWLIFCGQINFTQSIVAIISSAPPPLPNICHSFHTEK